MTLATPTTTSDSGLSSAIKLQLTSHRLSEKRCQVRFMAQHKDSAKPTKGHMLVDPQLSLREVAQIIRHRITLMQQHSAMHHSSFYCISSKESGSGFIFFEA
ncbi:MAG: hypothetical protein KY428_05660 [Bacteroidetes bacterium]|nr:hypothetical protein [Bacteroidota bacterium]